MDISIVDNNKFLVTLSSTESKLLHEIAFEKQQEDTHVLKDLVFGAIVVEHSQMALEQTLSDHTEYWNR